MYQLRQSATGQFVLVHPATETVVVADDLREAYDRMRALTGTAAADELPAVPAVKPAPGGGQGAKLGMIAVLALLPFVWLGALHVSLGRLVAELRGGTAAKDEPSAEEIRTRLDRLELRLDQQGADDRRAAPRPKAPRPAPAAAAPAAAPAGPTDGGGDETGDEG
jgi:hypothetical protein